MVLQCSTVFVALADPDGKTLVRFYRQLFGQKPVKYIPEVYAEFQLPGLRLGIFKPSTVHRSEFEGQAGSISLCIEVAQLEEAIASVEQAFIETRLTGDHLLPGDIMTSSHGREVYAYDPAGNRLILHETHLLKADRPQVDFPEADLLKTDLLKADLHKIDSDKQKRKNGSR